VLMNQRIEGDREAGWEVCDAFMDGDFELLRELVRQWDYIWNVTGKLRYPESRGLCETLRELRSEGIQYPSWDVVVGRFRAKNPTRKYSDRQLWRCKKEVDLFNDLPKRRRGRPAKK
jgi:hypothetical protein